MKDRHPLPWRDHLTPDEREVVEHADQLKAEWLKLSRDRRYIASLALQRAKYYSNRDAVLAAQKARNERKRAEKKG